jgi:nucleoside 2-deoxyribosyltransferase
MRIYLAGSFSNWREPIKTEVPQHQYLDPSDHHNLQQEDVYTYLDLEQVRMSDMVLARVDPENPSNYGASLEIGYASGLGIPVILIDELTPSKDPRSKYFGMARSVAQATVRTTNEAIDLLKALPR